MPKCLRAKAVVQATIEISVPSSTWDEDCTVGQIHKQARDEAANILAKLNEARQGTLKIIDPILVEVKIKEANL